MKKDLIEEALYESYIPASFCEEIDTLKISGRKTLAVNSIYFGGGTPHLSIDKIDKKPFKFLFSRLTSSQIKITFWVSY